MIVKYLYVKCDNCGEEAKVGGKTHSQARQAAEKVGWQKSFNYDFCPACVIAQTNRRELMDGLQGIKK